MYRRGDFDHAVMTTPNECWSAVRSRTQRGLSIYSAARVGYIVQSTMNVSADDLMRLGMDMQDEVDQDIMDDDGNEDAAGDMEVDGGGDDGDDDAVAIVSPQNGNKRIKATGSDAKNPKLYRCEHQTSCCRRMCALTSCFRFVL